MNDFAQHQRNCELESFGAFLIQAIADSIGIEPDPRRIDRAIYKGTDCGAWVNFDLYGILVGTIVECWDVEHLERISLQGIDASDAGAKELCKRFWRAVQNCEDFASGQWAEYDAQNK